MLNIIGKFLPPSEFFADADERVDWLAYAGMGQAAGFIPGLLCGAAFEKGSRFRTGQT